MGTRRVYEGVLEALPAQESKTIRVFFSSTFTDMTAERNKLMKEAVPFLRNYCLGKGLDFQVVDMRWGVREETSVDQMTTELCLKEIKNCQQISKGPNFVVLLGDRYGTCPLPATVPVKDFHIFHRVAMAVEKDIYLLDKWYLLDNNAVPPVYQIQPITNLLPHYSDTDPANQCLQEKDQKRWQDVEMNLKTLFHQLCREAYQRGDLDQRAYDRYFMSVTENEVSVGILEATDTSNRVVCFHRVLNNINIVDKKAGRFTDINAENQPDLEAKMRREMLTKNKIPAALNASQIHRYSVEWSQKGVDTENADHLAYLQSFCMDFQTCMIKMIDASLAQRSALADNDLFSEVLHHLHFSVKKSSVFFGREEELQDIQQKMKKVRKEDVIEETENEGIPIADKVNEPSADDYNNGAYEDLSEESYGGEDEERLDPRQEELKQIGGALKAMGVKFHLGDDYNDYESDPSRNPVLQQIELPDIISYKRPVVIHGESGSGKTALMAKIAQLSSSWIPNSVLIVRYLGTSPQSSSIREVLVSICRQIWSVYDIHRVTGIDLSVDFQYLVAYFNALLWKLDTSSKPLVILFDSVDQLSTMDHAHTLSWLPTQIPANVHVLVSLMPSVSNCLENARQHLPFQEQYVELSPFSEAAGAKMVSALGISKKRSLNILQKKFVMEQFAKCQQPLFLKLIVDEALNWKSFTPISDIQVGDSIRGAINKLFDKMERAHGFVLVSKAFGYLCAACQGLADTEMEDLLSLDDDVLQDTYLYHLPPDPRVIRLPPLLWKRIRGDISEYLTERQSGSKVVVSWYHRQFLEVAKPRYLDASVQKEFHSMLAQYFSGKWSSVEKPLELFKVKKGSFPNALRQVPSQPLRYENDSYNVRKLQELPRHLVLSDDFTGFYNNIGCSFEWMYAMCKTMSVTDVIVDLKLAMTSLDSMGDIDNVALYDDIKFVHDILVLGSDSIRRDPANLASQIVSQLSPQYSGSPAITAMVQSANHWLKSQPHPHLVPQGKIMPSPGGCLLSSISINIKILGNDRVYGSCMELNESKRQLYVTEQQPNDDSDKLRVYDLDDNLSCMAVEDLKRKVRSVKFKVNEKFLIIETYDSSSAYSFKSHFSVFDGTQSAPYDLNCDPVSVCVSRTGKHIAWCDRETVKIGSFKKKGRGVDVHNTLEAKTGYVQFTHDEKYLTVFSDKGAAVYDTQSGDVVIDLTPDEKVWSFGDGDTDYSRCTFVTKDNRFIHSGFGYKDKRNMYVTQIPSGETVYKFDGYEHYEFDLCYLEEKEEFLIAGNTSTSYINGDNNKQARVFTLKTGEQTTQLNCANGPYQDLKLFGDEDLWVLVAKWKDPVIYLLAIGQRVAPSKAIVMRMLSDHSQAILQYTVSSDHTMLFTASADNTIKLWDLPRLLEESKELQSQTSEETKTENEEEKEEEEVKSTNIEDVGQSTKFIFSKDSQDLFISTKTGKVLKRDVMTGNIEILSTGKLRSRRDARLICLTSSGQYLAVSSEGHVLVLDAKTLEKVYTLEYRTREMNCLEEGGNVLMAATAGMEAKGRLWNLDNGEVLRDVEFLYSFYATAVNHSGTQFIATMFDFPFILKVHQKEGEQDMMMNQPDTMMSACCGAIFSPDDKFAIACSGDGTIRVMEAATSRYLYNMRQRSSITNQTFSPDSKNLLTSGYRSIYVWTMSDGSLVCKLTRHQDFIVSIEFIRDGQFLVTGGRDKTVVIWDFERKVSICSFLAHCEVNAMAVTPDGMRIVYGPENVGSVAELKPNEVLKQMLEGSYKKTVPKAVEQAQALALGFSSQKVQKQATSAACVIL